MGAEAPPRVGGALQKAVPQQIMTPFVLDTNIIVDALRRRNDRHLFIDHLLDQGHPLASCPITLTQYAKRGRTLSFQDASIAAVCIAYNCTLITGNAKDFLMPELQIYPCQGMRRSRAEEYLE